PAGVPARVKLEQVELDVCQAEPVAKPVMDVPGDPSPLGLGTIRGHEAPLPWHASIRLLIYLRAIIPFRTRGRRGGAGTGGAAWRRARSACRCRAVRRPVPAGRGAASTEPAAWPRAA